jgi:hypothetical protein
VPLVLGLRLGKDVFVNDVGFVLAEIHSASRATIRNMKTKQSYAIDVGQSMEVLPDVFFAMGDRSTAVMSRISIGAPCNMKVLTGTRYRQLKCDKEAVRPPPSATADKKEYKVPADIVDKARELGIFGNTAEARIKQMVRLSTPMTMPGYNRRFQQYVLFIENDTVLAMDVLSAEDRAYFDTRHYEDRIGGDDHAAGDAEVEHTKTSLAAKAKRF